MSNYIYTSKEKVRIKMSKGILTKREREVFELLIKNYTTRDIADKLNISEKQLETIYQM